MKKLSLTLVLAWVSFLSYGQVIEGKDTAKSSVMEAIRPPVDGSYEKIHTTQYKPVGLPHLRQADAYWTQLVWQVVDLREKFNFPLYFPTEKKGNWKSLMQSILDALDSTEANPNPLRIYTDEYVNIPKSTEEVKQSMGQTKSIPKINPETFEEEGIEQLFVEWGAKEVYRYIIKEQWRIDKQRSVLDPVIIAILPMFWFEKDGESGGDFGGGGDFNTGDDAGEGGEDEDDMPSMPQRRWRDFGWIYYKEVRPTLAVTEVFNPANNAQRRNYDDLFLQRRFSSFIKAEENVHDNREINQYILNGLDQILEAEKIKDRIRVREHDMWEF